MESKSVFQTVPLPVFDPCRNYSNEIFFILPRCSFLLFPGLLPGRAAVPLSCLSLLAVPWPFIVTDSTKSCPKTWLGGTCRWETLEPFRACFPRPAPRHQVVLRMNSPLADNFLCEILFAIALFSSLTPRTSPAIEDGAGQMSALLQPRWSVPTRAHRTSRHKGLWKPCWARLASHEHRFPAPEGFLWGQTPHPYSSSEMKFPTALASL